MSEVRQAFLKVGRCAILAGAGTDKIFMKCSASSLTCDITSRLKKIGCGMKLKKKQTNWIVHQA